jgi:hypothetical protein
MRTNYHKWHEAKQRAEAFRAKDEAIRMRHAPGFSSPFGAEFQADTANLEALARGILEMLEKAKREPGRQDAGPRPAAQPKCPSGGDRACDPAIRPSIFDPERDLLLAQKFEHPSFQESFEPGEQVELYFGACSGTRRTGQYFGIPNYKIGTANIGNLIQRFQQHNIERYAACWTRHGEFEADDDFAWFPSFIPPVAPISENSVVAATPRTLIVQLPHDMTPLQFEAKLRLKLRHCALDRWLETPAALAHCRAIGADPNVGKRFTPYAFGMATKMSAAEEIYTLTPYGAAQSLVGVAEQIILEHLRLIRSDD